MKYYTEEEQKIICKKKVNSIKCDECGKNISERWFDIYIYQRDSYDSEQTQMDVCECCVEECVKDLLSWWGEDIEIEIKRRKFRPYLIESYNEPVDENMKLEGENNENDN